MESNIVHAAWIVNDENLRGVDFQFRRVAGWFDLGPARLVDFWPMSDWSRRRVPIYLGLAYLVYGITVTAAWPTVGDWRDWVRLYAIGLPLLIGLNDIRRGLFWSRERLHRAVSAAPPPEG